MDKNRVTLSPLPTPIETTRPARPFGLSRRNALLLPLLLPAVSACSWFDWLTDEAKKPVTGDREPVLAATRALSVDSVEPVTLPPVTQNADWLQFGRTVDHVGGNLAGGLTKAWSTNVGAGGNYRARFTAAPLVSGNSVFTMDTDGAVAAFDTATGKRIWRTVTKARKQKNSNLGGGIAIAGDRLYAVTGRAQMMAMNLSDGTVTWHQDLTAPARSAPLIVDNLIYVITIDQQLQAFELADGKYVWSYQGNPSNTGTIGQAGPAAADGLLVAGFESGDLAAVRLDSGTVVWTDNMGGIKGQSTLADFGSVRGGPVISGGLVYAIGLGGLMAALDLRSGRRVWQRDVAGLNTPWLAGDFLYVVSAEQKLAAIGKDDGAVHWVTDLPRFKNPKKEKNLITWFGPALVGGKLVLVSDHSAMTVVDAVSGTVVTTSKLPDTASTPPIVAGGVVYVLTDDATLTAYK
jgi:outer membrane protein assembly factor BamB